VIETDITIKIKMSVSCCHKSRTAFQQYTVLKGMRGVRHAKIEKKEALRDSDRTLLGQTVPYLCIVSYVSTNARRPLGKACAYDMKAASSPSLLDWKPSTALLLSTRDTNSTDTDGSAAEAKRGREREIEEEIGRER
jgi:hypothetical protein